ncbi:PREDICTED: uncharacterized protein LOC109583155 [Amphimedon queenslandica]|nr:PREDICTED: uncharacterized protein LOC109583155 [Amphimedon queenslandica]|eukprot:XP_019853929.1 PREDICTED: uncharacterized protein LOC109583155 [Amphimedon queenslandica]
MIVASITTLNAFTVNVSLSNNGGTFNDMSSFGFSFLGPVTNIDSSIDNCSSINITWTAPAVDDRVPIQYYILRIYNAITGSLVKNVSVYDTSYQFVDSNILIHRYTYVITGVNELGEGISINDTFSYQRVPRVPQNTSLDVLYYTQDVVIVQFYFPIILKCIGEAPKHVIVTVICNGIDSSTTYQIRNMNDITGLISVPLNQQCNISIVFSNEAGSSEPFILAFDTYPPSPNNTNVTTTVQTSPTTGTSVSTGFSISIVIVTAISLSVVIVLLLLIIISLIVLVITYKKKLYRSASSQQNIPTACNEAYEFNTLMINTNPTYEEIRGNRGGAVNL